jgi:hypothetical protein
MDDGHWRLDRGSHRLNGLRMGKAVGRTMQASHIRKVASCHQQYGRVVVRLAKPVPG